MNTLVEDLEDVFTKWEQKNRPQRISVVATKCSKCAIIVPISSATQGFIENPYICPKCKKDTTR